MPRLKSLEKSQAEPKAQEMMGNLETQKILLNIFRGMANSPAVLDGYLKLSGALKEGKLDGKAREAIALVVAQANTSPYCLAAHTAIGKKAGLDDAAIHDARLGKSNDKRTASALTLAKKLVAKQGHVAEADISTARSGGLDDGDIAEVVANVALNVMTNYFNNCNQTDVDFPKVTVEVQ
jgi:AhpD family alkylhydroperoxidase